MPLASGTRLGPYEIVAPLGAGGMGEVYKARDTRLNRLVAIKIMPGPVAADSERLRRFEQEAQAVAALNHTNILAIHDFGFHNSVHYLVTELLEGLTLRDRLDNGAMPLRKCVDLALQVARAMAAAHEKGIIHRDLKPENIFICRNGSVKVLDFGLAKLSRAQAASASGESLTAGLTAETSAGTVVGTVAYMSPEQVRGLEVDHRSDIFSFGVVLYEMISGRRPFGGATSADLMSSILTADPPPLSSPQPVPPALERIVRHCLEKDPEERFDSARDLGFGLEGLSSTSDSAVAVAVPAKSSRLIPALLGLSALCILAGVVWLYSRSSRSAVQPTFHQLTFQRGLIYGARFAPEGQTVFYSAGWNGMPLQVYSTAPSSPESRSVADNNGTLFAVSSSEMAISLGCRDLFIGACEGTLAVVPLSGGAPRALADNVISADWAPDGTRMAAIRESGGKFTVEFPLGKTIFESTTWMNSVRVSPDGRKMAFIQYLAGTGDYGMIDVLDTNGKILTQSEKSVSIEGMAWSAKGDEVWFGATRTHAWADAIHALNLSGKERIVLRLPGMLRLHDVARDGRVLLSKEIWGTGMQYHGPGDTKERDLSWLDAAVISDISSDGQQLAFGEYGEASGNGVLMTYVEKLGELPVKLERGYGPAFSPDGKWVIVNALTSPEHLALLPTGAGERKDLDSFGLLRFWSVGWMPDGANVYFVASDGQAWRLYVQAIANSKPRAITPPLSVRSQAVMEGHMVSPDGRWAFGRDLNHQAWLYPLNGGEPRSARLAPEDVWINWSADGQSGYVYQDEKTHARIFRVDLASGARQLVAEVTPPDTAGLVGITPVRITADGKAFVYSYDRSLSDLFLTEGIQ